jgi:hypothetical protein
MHNHGAHSALALCGAFSVPVPTDRVALCAVQVRNDFSAAGLFSISWMATAHTGHALPLHHSAPFLLSVAAASLSPCVSNRVLLAVIHRWMFVGSFFAMNLFVGVIVDNFNRIKKVLEHLDEGGTATMTAAQQAWAQTMTAAVKGGAASEAQHTPPERPYCRKVYELVTSRPFEGVIFGVIGANVALMASDYWHIEEDATIHSLYQATTLTFVHVYYFECVLKIVGLGEHYFVDRWCQLDFLLVLTAAVDEFAAAWLAAVGLSESADQLRLMRVLRILRVLRLLKGATQLKKLVRTPTAHTDLSANKLALLYKLPDSSCARPRTLHPVASSHWRRGCALRVLHMCCRCSRSCCASRR